jgi:hypothetical protein
MRRWLENRLTGLLAAAYTAAWARAIAALPHDELSCRTTNLPGVGGSGSGPARHRPSQSGNTKRQLAERTIYAVPLEQSERNNA